MKKNRIANGTGSGAALFLLRAVGLGTLVGALLCTLLLLGCAWAFVSMEHVPQAMVPQLVLAVSALSAFLAGLVSTRISRKRGLLCGGLAGLLLFLLLLLAGALSFHEVPDANTLTRLAAMAVSGAIGGFVAMSEKRRQ